jgi:hypothetical protein
MRKTQARPAPIHGMFDQSCTNRITQNIAKSREQMSVLLNGKILEPTLPDMPLISVMLVVSLDMTGHPPLHKWTECRFGCGLHDKMKVSRHQADTKKIDAIF